jgi:trans-aconitate 2-methyltransferase
MLQAAEPHAIADVLTFEAGDIATWTADHCYDLVFSNAALHWVPNHAEVLRRWLKALAQGGQIAVQVPYNHDHPAHTIAEELRTAAPFDRYDIDPDPVATNVLAPAGYAELLYDLGVAKPVVRLQVYGHELPDAHAVVEWVKGSTLTRFTKALPIDVYDEFERRYGERVLAALGDRAPYFYPFKRILLWGQVGEHR